MGDSTGSGIQGHVLRTKCWESCEEIHLGSQSDGAGGEFAASLLALFPRNTHILLGVEKSFWAGGC